MQLRSFSVIIPTWRRSELLLNTVQQLKKYDDHIGEILIYIDGGDEETEKILSENYPEISIIKSEVTLGPGGGRNLLLKAATSRYILSIDDDSFPDTTTFFGDALEVLHQFPFAGIISCCIYHRNEVKPQPTNIIVKEGYFEGCGCIYRKDALANIKGYVPIQWAYGVEELDMSLQLINKGWDIIKYKKLIVFHNTNLEHHDDPRKTSAAISNRLLLAYLRFPVFYLCLGGGMFLNRIFWSIKNKRYNGVIKGFFEAPFKIYRYKSYRSSVDKKTIKKWRDLLKQDL